MEVLRVLHLRILHVDVPLPPVWQLGMGWRVAFATRPEFWLGPRDGGFRGFFRRAYDRRDNGAGGCDCARPADRQIPTRRNDQSDTRSQFADGDNGHPDSRLRMVRL